MVNRPRFGSLSGIGYLRLLASAIVLLFSLSSGARAAPRIIATVVPSCQNGMAVLTVTFEAGTFSFYDNSLYYNFNLTAPGVLVPQTGNELEFARPLRARRLG
jgi:hypothetical protein